MMIVLVSICTLLVAIWLYFRQLYSTFEKSDVKNEKTVPLFGNMIGTLLGKEHMATQIENLYKAFPGERFVGRYEFLSDMVIVRDPELAKRIMIKDFDHFVDHRTMFEGGDSLFSRTLITLKGQEWKDMRSAMSPAFTSSKIRLMVPLMVEVGGQLIASVKNSIEASIDGYVDLECKDLTSRYSNDVIASCAFGLKVDSLKERNNEFYAMGKTTTDIDLTKMMKIFFLVGAPKFASYFNIDFMPASSRDFFKKLVLDTMKNRELKHIMRPDMIHLLMELQRGQLKHDSKPDDKTTGFATAVESSIDTKVAHKVWSETDLVAQAIIFFVAGFDTVSTAAMFLLYEAAVNPDIQEKLVQEINEHSRKSGGKFDFTSIQEMQYLDMVVSEVLRKWPPGISLDRQCAKDYNMGKPNEHATKDFIICKGKGLNIPVYAFHRDPKYFPEPEKFVPERFSEDNKHKINTSAYVPFGSGPRNCIGSRFALCELKVMVYQILQHFELSPCEKTCIPPELANDGFNLQLKGGNWLRFRVRR